MSDIKNISGNRCLIVEKDADGNISITYAGIHYAYFQPLTQLDPANARALAKAILELVGDE